jgi:hypothetical protein
MATCHCLEGEGKAWAAAKKQSLCDLHKFDVFSLMGLFRIGLALTALLLLLSSSSSAQETSTLPSSTVAQPLSDTPPQASEIAPVRFDWQEATLQSFLLLSVEHGFRLTQKKTRRELGGPFFKDWMDSVKGVNGWGDGDSFITNYVGHSMQGGVSGYIQIQNDPGGRQQEFGNNWAYWNSRMRALGWSALYSTQFELGPYSESAIGNVGKKKGTAGFVDLVVTPTGGMGMIVAEDWLDKCLIQKLEARTASVGRRRFYRVLFNPQRAIANVLRRKAPWHRDTRTLY